MKKTIIGISLLVLISALLLSSCDKEEYSPLEASRKLCTIEIECVDLSGVTLLNDRAFVDKIKIVGEKSHSDIKFTIHNNRVIFDADLPGRNEMKWSKDRHEATGMSKVTVKFGKQKATLKCLVKFTASKPPVVVGGTMTLEEVECGRHTYRREGNAVLLKLRFSNDGTLQ